MDFDSYARGLWAGRADAYEHGFARLTVHAVGALLDAAGVGTGTRVLDVGTGPGVVAGAAVARGARVTAVDAGPSMAEAGFTETAAQVLTWEFRVDPQEWWQVYRSSVGSSGAVIARQDDATIERIKGEFDSLAARYATGDGVPASAVLASGIRP
jgi:ribosomal protein L11 methylase PrmA